MKRKNKLPRYWLGTRMPTSTGYQQSYAPTNTHTSTPGYDVQPQANAIKNSAIPNALGKLSSSSSYALNALQHTQWIAPTAQALSKTIARPENLSMISSGSPTIAAQGYMNAAKQAGGRLGLNTIGTVTAGLGSLYGLTDMGFQLASNKDHRSAGDMRNTLTTNTYTTDFGNTYTQQSGVNRGAELRYANAQKLNRNLNFTTTAIGTGASIGSLFTPGVGTAIGAGVGALVGLGANLFGFGDTEEETKKQMDTLTDVVSNENRMNRSLALDKDAKQGFYSSQRTANCGKRPSNYRNGKGNAMISHGEVVGNLAEGWAYREPGIPDNKDTLKRHIKPTDFVISNKFGLSDYAAATGDYIGALKAQDMLMKQNGYYAKNGKLPRYDGGKKGAVSANKWDYALQAIPNLLSLAGAYTQYQDDWNKPVRRPSNFVDYSAARNNIYRMMGNRIDSRPYLNDIDAANSQAIYNIQRTPGLGLGGRAVLMDSANKAALAQKAKQRLAIDQANREVENAGYQALANIDQRSADINNENWYKNYALWQQSAAAKDARIAQDRINMINPIAQAARDYFSRRDYQDALGIKERMIKLYENQQEFDRQWMDHWLNGGGENKPAQASSNTSFKLTTPDLIQMAKGPSISDRWANQYLPTPQLTSPSLPYSMAFGNKYGMDYFDLNRFSKVYNSPSYAGPRINLQSSDDTWDRLRNHLFS